MTNKRNLVILSMLLMVLFFVLSRVYEDIIVNQFFLGVSLICCLNTIRLVPGNQLDYKIKNEKSTRAKTN